MRQLEGSHDSEDEWSLLDDLAFGILHDAAVGAPLELLLLVEENVVAALLV